MAVRQHNAPTTAAATPGTPPMTPKQGDVGRLQGAGAAQHGPTSPVDAPGTQLTQPKGNHICT